MRVCLKVVRSLCGGSRASTEHPAARRRSARRILAVCILLGLAAFAVRLLLLQGWLRPVRIASGSMAPDLLGPHWETRCGDCGYLVQIDASQAQGDETVVCPNCGFARNPLCGAALRRGERVLIDRAALWLRRPRRFESAALQEPQGEDRLAVKRVVGLPGERLEVRGGEAFANGLIVRKTFAKLREMAVPVYDDRFRPRDDRLPPRWRDDQERWTRSGGIYAYPGDFQPFAQLRSRPQLAWLRYRHWRCSPLPGLRTKESPVLDDYGYNLGPPRQLNAVTDLMLRCRVQTVGEGCLAVALHDGREEWQVRIWPRRGEATLRRAGREVAQARFSRQVDESPFLLEAALCDRRVLAAVDGATILTHAYEPASAERRPSPRPLALGAAGLAAEASELVVARDVYYLPPPGRGAWRLAAPLGDDEYLLLGDNAPISQDSRVWPQPNLPNRELRGPIRRWPLAP